MWKREAPAIRGLFFVGSGETGPKTRCANQIDCSQDVMNTTDVGAALANCRALIDQINAGLSAEEPFVDVSSATELLFYLKRAASALNSAPKNINF